MTTTTTTRRLAVISLAAGLMAAAAAAQEPVTIVGVGVRRTVDCGNGGSVTIMGSDHKLTLRGRCESVSVTGTHHLVQIQGLGRLTVTGVDHRVEWEYALTGDQPVVLKTGLRNEVVQVKGGTSRESA